MTKEQIESEIKKLKDASAVDEGTYCFMFFLYGSSLSTMVFDVMEI